MAHEGSDGVKLPPTVSQTPSGSKRETTPEVATRRRGENGNQDMIKSAHHNKDVPMELPMADEGNDGVQLPPTVPQARSVSER